MGCRLWGHTESDTTEQLHFHFSLSCIGEEMATQCSILASFVKNKVSIGVSWAYLWAFFVVPLAYISVFQRA